MQDNSKEVDANQKKVELYLGDLEKTQLIQQLLQTPAPERDAAWSKAFFSHLPTASFRSVVPQVVTGPGGFPYFQLFLPEPGQPFQCFVLGKMKDDFLLGKGFGVVLNPTTSSADWVFTYGDILHYHQKNTFEYPEIPPQPLSQEALKESEEVMIAAPSEEFFPQVTRNIVRNFLITNGNASPKVFLMTRSGEPHLAFNISPESMGNEEKCQALLQALTWFFPRDYRLIGADEKQFENHMKPL